jgi:hypothetical protein
VESKNVGCRIKLSLSVFRVFGTIFHLMGPLTHFIMSDYVRTGRRPFIILQLYCVSVCCVRALFLSLSD